MAEFMVMMTTIDGERLDIEQYHDADNHWEAVETYFKKHNDPKQSGDYM